MKAILQIPLCTKEIVLAVGGYYNAPEKTVNYICTDSRELSDGGVFFAIGKGEVYTKEAVAKGLVVSAENSDCVLVSDVKRALLDLAAYYKTKLKFLKKTIAITGSVGKTTVKDYTAALLSGKYKTHKTLGNYNNDIGLPLTLFSAPADTEVLVLEMGMNHTGEIRRLSLCAKPDICVITNIGSAHIGNLGSREAIAKAKREILVGMKNGMSIIPADEPLLNDIAPSIRVGENGDVALHLIKESSEGLHFFIKSKIGATNTIYFPWNGIHFASNLSFALAASTESGMTLNELNDILSDHSLFIPRQNIINTGELLLYNDSYNASEESYIADFKILAAAKRPKSALIGDILELGEKAEEIHLSLGKYASEFKLDRIYPFGNYARAVAEGAIKAGFKKDCIFINDNTSDPMKSAELICENSTPGEMILIKGSHAIGTERIIDCIKLIKEKNS